jgi:uncharacterized membrane protein (DUF4010 family)
MLVNITPERLLLLFGLAFFFGLAFEEFYGERPVKTPGGVRTFPLLALAGGGLYLLEPTRALPFSVGLIGVCAWLFLYYRRRIELSEEPGQRGAGLMVPICNLLAYLLGPIVLWAPVWVGVAITVAAVLLLGAREPLHALARRVPQGEIATLGQFLILTGIVLPLLPNHPVTKLTTITPYQVWLAVVAVSTLSYASYLTQRYVAPTRGSLVASLLGGLYSSTATTVVLARRLGAMPKDSGQIQAGIVLATAVMYLRIAVVVGIFSLPLAEALLPALLALAAFAFLLAVWCHMRRRSAFVDPAAATLPANPLQLTTALLFAGLFVIISLASSWVQTSFGQSGLYWLAAVLGVSDIDPFVLSIAQGSAGDAPLRVLMVAILIAASSNNMLKAVYAVAFSRSRSGIVPAAALALLGASGVVIALWLAGKPI